MIWRITAYNGTVWNARYEMTLFEAINEFLRDTMLSQVDIKSIENLS